MSTDFGAGVDVSINMGYAVDTTFAYPTYSISGSTLSLGYPQNSTKCTLNYKWTIIGIVQ